MFSFYLVLLSSIAFNLPQKFVPVEKFSISKFHSQFESFVHESTALYTLLQDYVFNYLFEIKNCTSIKKETIGFEK